MQKRSVLTGLCIFLAIFFLTIPLFSYAQKDPAKPAKTESTPATPTAEVRFDGKVLFVIKERIFSFSPEDRARAITERIDALAKDSLLRLDEIQAIDSDEGAAVSYRDRTIMTITDRDARVAGKPRLTLAQEYAEKIRISIKEKQARYSFRSILFGILYALIITGVLIAILILFKWIFPKIYGIVHSWKGTRIRSIVIQAFEALSADRLVGMLITCVKGFRVFLTIVLFYFYIPLVFSFFPWTQNYAGILFGYLVYPFKTVGSAIIRLFAKPLLSGCYCGGYLLCY